MTNGPTKLPKGAIFDLKTGQWFIPAQPTGWGYLPDGTFRGSGNRLSFSYGVDTQGKPVVEPESTTATVVVDVGENKRGAVVQFGRRWTGDGFEFSGRLSEEEDTPILHAALLFCDVIDWPYSNIAHPMEVHPMAEVLGGQLVRTALQIEGSITIDRLREAPYFAYEAHENAEPGVWSIWHGDNDLPVPADKLTPELGFRLRLQDALILPARDVPLEDTIAFRERHGAKLTALRHHLDGCCQSNANSSLHDGAVSLRVGA